MRNLNSEALAYAGDAVYELYVRSMLLESGTARVNNLHRRATEYVKAAAQAKAIKEMFPELTEKEQALVKRARNHRFHSKAKNADPVTYKWATAFEALVGYLYLAGDMDRMKRIMSWAVEITDNKRK
ncbi:MAG: ribonuclease III domain-containing protein [Firmicutes bacterium]|nr:ribonuclease III domain-containing protein [Bacillota bacterium]